MDKMMNGILFSDFLNKSIRFINELELLGAMEDLFNSVNFPQASFDRRSFYKKSKQISKKAEKIVDDSIVSQNEKTTFVVNVQYRRNSSWQGTITWVEQDRTRSFRSALEMLKLMEEASNQGIVEVVDWK
jgi:hypothetical protein